MSVLTYVICRRLLFALLNHTVSHLGQKHTCLCVCNKRKFSFCSYKTNISRYSNLKYGLNLLVLTSEKLVIFLSKSKLLIKILFQIMG